MQIFAVISRWRLEHVVLLALALMMGAPLLSASDITGYYWMHGSGQVIFGIMALVSFACLVAPAFYHLRPVRGARPVAFLQIGLLLMLCASLPLLGAPATSWDGVTGWYQISRHLFETCGPGVCIFENEHPIEARERYLQRHGEAIFWLNAYVAALSVKLGTNLLIPMLSLVPVLMFINLLFIFFPELMRRRLQAALATYAILHTPLVENHIYSFGYNGLFVCSTLLLSIYFSWRLLERFSLSDFGCACLSMFFLVSMKNTGLIFSGVVVITILVMSLVRSPTEVRKALLLGATVLFFICVAAIFISMRSGSEIENVYPGKYSLLLNAGDQYQLQLAGYSLTIQNNIGQAIDAVLVSLIKNQSFSVLFVVWCVFLVARLGTISSMPDREALFLLSTIMLYGVAFLYFAFTSHGIDHFREGSDTFGSRLLIAPVIFSVFHITSVVMAETSLSASTNPEHR